MPSHRTHIDYLFINGTKQSHFYIPSLCEHLLLLLLLLFLLLPLRNEKRNVIYLPSLLLDLRLSRLLQTNQPQHQTIPVRIARTVILSVLIMIKEKTVKAG